MSKLSVVECNGSCGPGFVARGSMACQHGCVTQVPVCTSAIADSGVDTVVAVLSGVDLEVADGLFDVLPEFELLAALRSTVSNVTGVRVEDVQPLTRFEDRRLSTSNASSLWSWSCAFAVLLDNTNFSIEELIEQLSVGNCDDCEGSFASAFNSTLLAASSSALPTRCSFVVWPAYGVSAVPLVSSGRAASRPPSEIESVEKGDAGALAGGLVALFLGLGAAASLVVWYRARRRRGSDGALPSAVAPLAMWAAVVSAASEQWPSIKSRSKPKMLDELFSRYHGQFMPSFLQQFASGATAPRFWSRPQWLHSLLLRARSWPLPVFLRRFVAGTAEPGRSGESSPPPSSCFGSLFGSRVLPAFLRRFVAGTAEAEPFWEPSPPPSPPQEP